MSSSNLSPHDRYMRKELMDVEIAKTYFERTLPPEILQIVDLTTLAPQSTHFIDQSLSSQVADVLYKVDFVIGGKIYPSLMYLLIEHSSTAQFFLPLRMMGYMVRIWEHYIKNDKKVRPLPIIYPQIIYNGETKYCYSLDFFDLFMDNKNFARELMNNPIRLLDLSVEKDENLQQFTLFHVCAYVAKHIHDIDMLPVLEKTLVGMLQLCEKLGFTELICDTMGYIFEAGQVSDREAVQACLLKNLQLPETKERIMRIADELRKEGFEEAMRTSKHLQEKAEILGRKEQKKETALTMLGKGATVEMVAQFMDITEDEVRSYMHMS